MCSVKLSDDRDPDPDVRESGGAAELARRSALLFAGCRVCIYGVWGEMHIKTHISLGTGSKTLAVLCSISTFYLFILFLTWPVFFPLGRFFQNDTDI